MKTKKSSSIKGKKVRIVIAEAIKMAKKGARIYRATNNSNFGLPYLSKLKDRSRKMELIIIK